MISLKVVSYKSDYWKAWCVIHSISFWRPGVWKVNRKQNDEAEIQNQSVGNKRRQSGERHACMWSQQNTKHTQVRKLKLDPNVLDPCDTDRGERWLEESTQKSRKTADEGDRQSETFKLPLFPGKMISNLSIGDRILQVSSPFFLFLLRWNQLKSWYCAKRTNKPVRFFFFFSDVERKTPKKGVIISHLGGFKQLQQVFLIDHIWALSRFRFFQRRWNDEHMTDLQHKESWKVGRQYLKSEQGVGQFRGCLGKSLQSQRGKSKRKKNLMLNLIKSPDHIPTGTIS